MKKVLLFIVLLMPFNTYAISASSAVVMDLNSKRVLYNSNMHEKRLIASITKIMTCIVAIENADINKKVEVGEEVLKAYGSAIYIEVGEIITLKDLLYGLMLRSGNDAAIEIAYATAKDMESFVYLMNEMAQNIGMKNTKFYNNHGLEENDGVGNISTAYDMALLTKYAINNKTFRKIFGTKKYSTKTNKKSYTWTSKNKLIHRYDYITGGKTGFTKKARRTLVTTASKNNIDLVIVTLNDANDFQDHITLYNSIFNKYKSIQVLNKNNFKIKNEKYYSNHTLYIKNDYYAAVTEKEKNNLRIKYVLEKNKNPLDKDIVGYAEVYLKDEALHKENIFIKINQNNKKSIFGKFKDWFKKW